MSGKIVYSTGSGDLRKSGNTKPDSGKTKPSGIKNDGKIRVRRETSGRGGKTVCVIYGLPLHGKELEDYGRQIKKKCGCGGTVVDGTVIIQGDSIEKVISLLEKDGYKAVKSGG